MSRYLVMVALIGCVLALGACSFPRLADLMPDAADSPALRCDPTAPFEMPIEVTAINLSRKSNESAYLSPDELTMWFSTIPDHDINTPDQYDIYQASRTSTAEPFRGIRPVGGVNTPDNERGPRVTADGLRMFAMIGFGLMNFDIKLSVRNRPDVDFGPLENITGVTNDQTSEAAPYLLSTTKGKETILYFRSNVDSNSGKINRIYRSVNAGGSFLVDPVVIQGVDVEEDVDNPAVTSDELTLYVLLRNDIYVATRASVTDNFQNLTKASDLSSPDVGLEAVTWISEDHCVLYLTRQIPGAVAYKVYSATRRGSTFDAV